MRDITFLARIFKHDEHRFGLYIPSTVIKFYDLQARHLFEGLRYRKRFPPDMVEVLTTNAYDYHQRGTIRLLFPDFYGGLSSGDMLEVTVRADIP